MKAHQVIADAVAAIIAARIAAALAEFGIPPDIAARSADAEAAHAVRDLSRDGWHITALPLPTTPETPR